MTKNFEQKVIREGCVDTAKYRYIARERFGVECIELRIYRLPIDLLDSTASIDGWELVKVVA